MPRPENYLNSPVRSLQTMLRDISEADARVLPLIPDGFYGKNTYASVRSFQQAYDLPDSGTVDYETWRNIAAIHSNTLPKLISPQTIPVWSTEKVLSFGEENYHLYLVQAMLRVLAEFFPSLQAPEVNGILNQDTADGLRWLQRAAELPETGELNAETWHVLNGLYRVIAGEGSIAK